MNMKLSSVVLLLWSTACLLIMAPRLSDAAAILDSSDSSDMDDDWLPFPGIGNTGRSSHIHRLPPLPPPTPPRRDIPYVFFHDNDYDHDIVDLEDLMDNDIDTGQAMVVLPSNWTLLTLRDINDAVEACRTKYCRPYEACIVGDHYHASCQCPTASICDRLQTPQVVCASNRQTYINRCLLRVDECVGGQLIRILHREECRQRTAVPRGGRRRFQSRVRSNASGAQQR